MVDFADEEYKQMLCIDATVMKRVITLKRGVDKEAVAICSFIHQLQRSSRQHLAYSVEVHIS